MGFIGTLVIFGVTLLGGIAVENFVRDNICKRCRKMFQIKEVKGSWPERSCKKCNYTEVINPKTNLWEEKRDDSSC